MLPRLRRYQVAARPAPRHLSVTGLRTIRVLLGTILGLVLCLCACSARVDSKPSPQVISPEFGKPVYRSADRYTVCGVSFEGAELPGLIPLTSIGTKQVVHLAIGGPPFALAYTGSGCVSGNNVIVEPQGAAQMKVLSRDHRGVPTLIELHPRSSGRFVVSTGNTQRIVRFVVAR